MAWIYDLTIQGGLLLLIVVTPLAFGSVYPWGIALMQGITLLMALAWVLKQLQERKLRLVRTPLNLPILLFFGLLWLQLLPLPSGVLRLVSSSTYALYHRTLTGWPEQAPLLLVSRDATAGQAEPDQADAGAGEWRPLSLYPHATRVELGLALTYAAVFLLVVNTLQTRRQLARMLLTLMGVGGVIAVLGLIQKMSGATKIYWFWQPVFAGSPFGPYVNRNHFAGYMVMVLPLGLGWLWGQLVSRARDVRAHGWRERLAALIGGRNGRLLLLVVALVHTAAALIFSASRGGILSLAGAVIFFSLLVWLPRGEGRRLGLIIPALIVCVLAYAIWLGIDPVVERFFQTDEDRPLYWSATLNLAAEYPLLGTGLGTYVSTFRRHKPVLSPGLVDHAHNDYLELLAEAGAVGFLLVVGGLGWFGWCTLQRWSGRHNPEVRGIVLGGLASVFAIGIHSVMDFNLHIPANALLLAIVLGLAYVAVHLRHRHGRSVATFRTRELNLPSLFRLPFYPLAFVGTFALAVPVVQGVLADRQAQQAELLERGAEDMEALEVVVEEWIRAVALDPGNADYHLRVGQAYERIMRAQWSGEPMRALTAGVRAMTAFREAALRHPTSPFPYLAWGWVAENVGSLASWAAAQYTLAPPSARASEQDLRRIATQLAREPDRTTQFARRLFQTATYLAPTAAFGHYSAGLHTLQQWETLGPAERTRVVQELRTAAELEPTYAPTILQTLWERTRDRGLVRAVARGTSEEARWRDDDSPATLAR